MNLFENENIFKMYSKNMKKSIYYINRIDIFIVIVLLILLITPLIVNLFSRAVVEPKQVNLYISVNSNDLFGKELMETLILEFEEQNPDIRLRAVNSASEAEPDILFFTEGDYNTLTAADALIELNSFTNYESGTRQMAIPLVSFMDMLFYNIDILSAAGFDHPPKTRDEFTAYARAVLRGKFNAAGYALSLSPNDHQALTRDIFSWIWAAGGNFLTGENDTPFITRAITSDISFFGLLNREGLLAPNIFKITGDQRLDEFILGKVAMVTASTREIPYLRAIMGDDAFGVTTIPTPGTGGKYSSSISSIYAGISAYTAYPDEAWSFLAFLAEKSSLLCSELKAVPGIISNIIPGDYVSDDPFYSKAWDIFESSVITEGFSGKHGEEYEAVFLEELQLFFESNRTVQQTTAAIQKRWDEISANED
jgi:ABC-type glycerol-3-phosphate transport system substrate-binding protein